MYEFQHDFLLKTKDRFLQDSVLHMKDEILDLNFLYSFPFCTWHQTNKKEVGLSLRNFHRKSHWSIILDWGAVPPDPKPDLFPNKHSETYIISKLFSQWFRCLTG